MIAVYILLFLLLVVLFLLFLDVHLIFDCHDKLSVTLKVLCFRFDGFDLIKKIGESEDGEKDTKKGKKAEKKNRKIDLLGFAQFLGHIAKVIALGLRDYVTKAKVNLKELRVTIGTEDAAQTALLSSAVMQGANGLCAALGHFSDFRCNNKNLSITPDFTSDKSSISFHLVVTNKLYVILGILFRTYIRFFEGKEDNHARNSIKTGH